MRGDAPVFRVTGADLAMHRGRYIGIFGELDVPPLDALNAALAVIAGAGPHTRVGLVPALGTRRWQHDLTPIAVREVPPGIGEAGMGGVLEHLRHQPGPRAPLQVHVTDRLMAVDVDHGLGDGRFLLDFTTSLLALSRGETPEWVGAADSRVALARAVAHTFGRRPQRLRRAWSVLSELRSARPTGDSGEPALHPWSPAPAVEVVHIGAEQEAALDAWRRAEAPNAAIGATWMHAVYRALELAGVPMARQARVAVDVRRYLPAGRRVNGNFLAGIDIPVRAGDTVAATGRHVRDMVDAAVPLVMMSVVSALTAAAAARRSVIGSEPATSRRDAPAHLMYSDLGRLPMLDGQPWRSVGVTALTGLLDPSGPEHLSVFSTSIRASRCLSITFHDNVFERSRIREAARTLGENPVALLDAIGG